MIRIEERNSEPHLLDKNDTKILRGISAWFVVIAHFTAWFDLYDMAAGIGKVIVNILLQLGGIGVMIFFFVSGYGICISYGGRKIGADYVVKRLKGVYIPYIAVKLILVAIECAVSETQRFSLSSFKSIILVEDWFIQVIILQYIVFYLIKKFASERYLILWSFVADIVMSVIFIIQDRPIGWFNALWLFTAGMFAAVYEENIKNAFGGGYAIAKIIGLIVIFGLIGFLFAVNKGAMWANAAKPLAGVALCLALCGIFRFVRINSAFLGWSGICSMYIYIVHVNVYEYTKTITSSVMCAVVTLAVTIVISWTANKMFKLIWGKLVF